MKVEDFNSIYFVGAGGIGMSALVRYFLAKNLPVGGYDKTPSKLTEQLIVEGAQIHYEDNSELIPSAFKDNHNTLVIYTPAIPESHKELSFFKENEFTIMKRAQVLGLITRSSKGLCIAGTHGKTTTSTMLAHLLHESGVGCTAFLGGISENYHTNLLVDKNSPYTVIEADEFDRSFHHLHPYISVITSAEPDHLDIYGTKEAYLKSFVDYTALTASDGVLLIRKGLEVTPELAKGTACFTYSRDSGDYHAKNIRIEDGEVYFDFVGPEIEIANVKLGVPIAINIENGIAAMAVAHLCGATPEEIKQAMGTFKGVERRFEFLVKNQKHVFINDYAHHPAEIKQSILSVKELYPLRKVTVVFQPHLFSRTKDFYQDFAQSLALADNVIVLDIYPAREEPIEGVTSDLIYQEISLTEGKKELSNTKEIISLLSTLDTDIILTLGAGDINLLTPQIKALLDV